MTKDEAKSALEREVFRDFAKVAGLSIAANGIESRRPPEPDILCSLMDGRQVAFELVQLVDRDLAHTIVKAEANPTNPRAIWYGDPTLETIKAKLEKNYESPHPMELLAWGGDLLLPQDVWVPTFTDEIRRLFDESARRFQRLWVVNLGRLAASDPIWLDHQRVMKNI